MLLESFADTHEVLWRNGQNIRANDWEKTSKSLVGQRDRVQRCVSLTLWKGRSKHIHHRRRNQGGICRKKLSFTQKYYLQVYHYMNKLQSFVNTIGSRVTGLTKLAPNNVSRKHVPHLCPLAAEKLKEFIRNHVSKLVKQCALPKRTYPSTKVTSKIIQTKFIRSEKFQLSTLQDTTW